MGDVTPRTVAEMARCIDHTLLAPEATRDEVLAACADATAWGVAAVCLSPSRLPLPAGVPGAGVATCSVVGFPSAVAPLNPVITAILPAASSGATTAAAFARVMSMIGVALPKIESVTTTFAAFTASAGVPVSVR